MAAERLSVFPAFHKVSGRTIVVVGGGAEALAKVRLLLETDAAIRLVAEALSGDLLDIVGDSRIEHLARPFLCEDLQGAVLAFAASGDREVDALVVAAARKKGVPVNSVDSPDLCDFYTPAIVNRAPVAVAISSTGAGPVLAQQLRARIEALLPMRLGGLASLANSFRSTAERVLPKGQPRRRFWSTFFEGRVADLALAGRIGDARRLASRLLTEAGGVDQGFVWLVGAGPGAADLLTLRAQRLLQEADVIVHDAVVPGAVLAMGRRDAKRVGIGGQRAARGELASILVREASRGQRVVFLDAGDPFMQRAKEIAALEAAAIPFDLVPGVNAPSIAAVALDARAA